MSDLTDVEILDVDEALAAFRTARAALAHWEAEGSGPAHEVIADEETVYAAAFALACAVDEATPDVLDDELAEHPDVEEVEPGVFVVNRGGRLVMIRKEGHRWVATVIGAIATAGTLIATAGTVVDIIRKVLEEFR